MRIGPSSAAQHCAPHRVRDTSAADHDGLSLLARRFGVAVRLRVLAQATIGNFVHRTGLRKDAVVYRAGFPDQASPLELGFSNQSNDFAHVPPATIRKAAIGGSIVRSRLNASLQQYPGKMLGKFRATAHIAADGGIGFRVRCDRGAPE
jgi:hypothetical protein